MASKRKKSRPTRITEEDVSNIAEGPQASYNAEYTLTEIQRYIEEGSEDTPDCLEKKLDLTEESNVECISSAQDVQYETAVQLDDWRDGDQSFPQIFVNGHIPYNLKFHQLMKDECERVTENVAIPETMSAFFNSDELISFRQAVPSKKLSRKRSRPIEDETPRYSCTMCKYVTNRSDHYKRHLMTHSADKPLKCTLCSYGTGRSDHYKRHLQRHGMSEDEIIATCFRNGLKLKNTAPIGQPLENENQIDKSKENLEKTNLVSATPTPTRQEESNVVIRVEKKFKCNQCSYSTNKSSHLTRHQNTHSKSYLSYCDKCNKSFRTPYTRKDHNCIGRQGHKCPKCTKIFAERKTLMHHIADKHHYIADDLIPETTSIPQSLPMQRHMTVANKMRMPSYAIGAVFSPNRNGVGLRNHQKSATSPYTSTSDDIQDYQPMDLTVGSRRENGNAVSNFAEPKVHSVISAISDDASRSIGLISDVRSDNGNLGCTRCGEWFNKLNEYSTHTCVS